jgi:hypothetical protein
MRSLKIKKKTKEKFVLFKDYFYSQQRFIVFNSHQLERTWFDGLKECLVGC